MTGPSDDQDTSEWDGSGIRATVLVLTATQAIFPVYAIYYIAGNAPIRRATEWNCSARCRCCWSFPLLTLPALIGGLRRKSLGRALISVLLAAMLNAIFYLYLVGQFAV